MGASIAEGEDLPARYRVISQLGRGAFAVAYRCEDTEAGGDVVVKLYELRGRGWSLLTSFEREAAVLSELSHPAIPRYLAHAQLPNGRLMLVQGYATGRSLAALLRDGRRFTDDEVADLAEQVLGVLDYLQSLNPPIIHRDIKPGNLVLDEARRVQLVDFGSVKDGFRLDSELGSTIVGTYGYMAPEQFQGRATIQSDLYGLGATLVHVLAHMPPAAMPQDGLKLDFHDSVKASPGTIAWLERMLEPDPRQRFANAKQALAAFRQRDSAAVAVVPVTTAVRTRESPPHGSRIVAQERSGELSLQIPGSGFRGSGLGLFGFASVWLIFITVWTGGAARGSLLFALFSVPFWLIGVWMVTQAVFAMFGLITIRIGPERYSVRKRLFGSERLHEGLTAHLEGASLGTSDTRVNGRRIEHCVLHSGVREIKFGTQLGFAERRWVVDRINEHLGISAAEDEEEDEDT
jgi:eukaryotic-like serine/threonine-protein kinase